MKTKSKIYLQLNPQLAEQSFIAPISNLHEYRLAYPATAHQPTLTQASVLGSILARIDLRNARLARRRAFYAKVNALPHQAWSWTLSQVAALFHFRPLHSHPHQQRPMMRHA